MDGQSRKPPPSWHASGGWSHSHSRAIGCGKLQNNRFVRNYCGYICKASSLSSLMSSEALYWATANQASALLVLDDCVLSNHGQLILTLGPALENHEDAICACLLTFEKAHWWHTSGATEPPVTVHWFCPSNCKDVGSHLLQGEALLLSLNQTALCYCCLYCVAQSLFLKAALINIWPLRGRKSQKEADISTALTCLPPYSHIQQTLSNIILLEWCLCSPDECKSNIHSPKALVCSTSTPDKNTLHFSCWWCLTVLSSSPPTLPVCHFVPDK